MKVKMLQSLAGSTYSYAIGAEAQFPDKEAKRLIEAGIAEALPAKKKAPAKKAEPEAEAPPAKKKPAKSKAKK